MIWRPLFAAATVGLTLTACSSLLRSDEPPRRTYWLQPVEIAGAFDTPVSIRVELVPGLDSDRINVLQRDRRLNHYAGAFWTDRLSRILPSLLDRSLNTAPGASTRQSPSVDVLVERLFAVEAVNASDPPTVELRARVSTTGQTANVHIVEYVNIAAGTTLEHIVKAYQQAIDQLAFRIREISTE